MTEARFPHVRPDRGHYESFYLRAVDPARPRGVWIRYTTHQRPGRPPTGSLWFTYFEADADVAIFARGLERLTELFLAAGARSVILPVARRHEVRAGEPIRLDGLRAPDLKLMAFHPLGTASGVVDPHLRLHGTQGVHVADGSVVPGPLGVNPQITIMALASRLAGRLLETTEVPATCRS